MEVLGQGGGGVSVGRALDLVPAGMTRMDEGGNGEVTLPEAPPALSALRQAQDRSRNTPGDSREI
jgi:hypothetical protein